MHSITFTKVTYSFLYWEILLRYLIFCCAWYILCTCPCGLTNRHHICLNIKMHVGIKWHHLGPDLCLSLINTFLVFNSAYSVKLSSYKNTFAFLVITNNVRYLEDDKLLSTGVQKPISTRSCLSNISSNNKQNLPTTRFLKSLKTLFYHKKNTLHQKLWFPHAWKPQCH